LGTSLASWVAEEMPVFRAMLLISDWSFSSWTCVKTKKSQEGAFDVLLFL
jgi:hypothetical protein